ncbi:MAG TPA: protein-methionine-sulfoxide reductase catalytic subunit MsrP [Kofleriaceae bacterium]|nr:protein-methionine-sulfoxide reductase catalytic subunit MsrP [Kofleriaceae bacterium]
MADDPITPPGVYFNRRALLRGGMIAAGAVATGWLYRRLNGVDLVDTKTPELAGLIRPQAFAAGEEPTPLASIANYNNFYEFTTNKDGVAGLAKDFKSDGWKIEVGGMCHAPRTFDLDDVRRVSPPEERVYRHRCVETWSIVVPWAGYSLSKLLAQVQPTSDAKYVAFETLLDKARFPGQNTDVLQWPYVEGLRIDEAMHPLALLATGMYGHELPPQDGAPVRMVIPWKYGFKSIKSIVKITLTNMQPPTTWNLYAPKEYGFFANVNPNHPHPRWSQASEQRLGESGRRKTLLFNGYADQVAQLYTGMDLDVYY